MKSWECLIGGISEELFRQLPEGLDSPLRQAVKKAFFEATGIEAEFCFSGWGGEPTHIQTKIILERRNKFK